MNAKFIKKFMLLAKTVAEDNQICYSRQIGVVIVDPRTNGVVSIGYNGPPQGTPHTDDPGYLEYFLFPQLTAVEKELLLGKLGKTGYAESSLPLDFFIAEEISRVYPKTCPRKLLECKPGERSELCSCQHAERNALTKLPISPHGLVMFCWCGVPCIQCAGSIINANIAEVHCLEDTDYQSVSRFLFDKSNTALFEYSKSFFEEK